MKVKHTVPGWLIGVALTPAPVFLIHFSGRAMWSDEPVVSWPVLAALLAFLFAVTIRFDRRGVFDTPDGGVIVKRTFTNKRIAASAEPATAFDRWLVGHRLVIQTNDGRRIRTGFWFRKPALNDGLEPPANLSVGASTESHPA